MAANNRLRATLLILLPMTVLLLPVLITSSSSNLIRSQTQIDSSNYYDRCGPYVCGNINFSFPFSPSDKFGEGPYDCGLPGFQIACDSSNSTPSIELSGRLYRVIELFPSENDRVITVVDQQLIQDVSSASCSSLGNLTIPNTDNGVRITSLTLAKGAVNLTIIECPSTIDLPGEFLTGIVSNYSCRGGGQTYVWDGTQRDPRRPIQVPGGCRFATLPISGDSLVSLRSNGSSRGGGRPQLAAVLGLGFELEWADLQDCATCQRKDGRCGYDGGVGRIVCFCKGGCGHAFNWKVIVGAAGIFLALLCVALVLWFKYKARCSAFFNLFCWGKNQTMGDERNAKEFIKSYQSTLLTNYSYKDIKKMTNGFKEKLGKGGYGNVFKGEFSDGRLIAVKMLDNNKGDNNNFLNEVNTIGWTRHYNIIRLLGFCWDDSTQALIYEYMPNKSLGDLLSEGETSNVSIGLPRLLEIAKGVAHGLEYLHNGCDSRILHLDIKPHNVLLDENFNPKISDFGLAKLYSRNQSAVTMTGVRGTIGFIAPEVFMRNLGKPSHKSDVYSFGMLLIDMVDANKQVEPNSSTRSTEAYFPDSMYEKLVEEMDMEFDQDSTIVEEEVFVARKMKMVGFWCIQMNPRDRPSMSRVIEMLSGDVKAIEMPPKPVFLSTRRSQLHDEIITPTESEISVLPLTGDSDDIIGIN